MKMPGFTAEASISMTNGKYKLMADKVQYLGKPSIIPQLHVVYNGCVYECDLGCRLLYCYA
jgi:hypothetical protein